MLVALVGQRLPIPTGRVNGISHVLMDIVHSNLDTRRGFRRDVDGERRVLVESRQAVGLVVDGRRGRPWQGRELCQLHEERDVIWL